jgi:uncharacterized membrane protein HdeD (DUF308 family)
MSYHITTQSVVFQDLFPADWKAFLWRGIVAVILAALAWLMPAEAVLTLTIVFGAYSFADGVLGLWSGYKTCVRVKAGAG